MSEQIAVNAKWLAELSGENVRLEEEVARLRALNEELVALANAENQRGVEKDSKIKRLRDALIEINCKGHCDEPAHACDLAEIAWEALKETE